MAQFSTANRMFFLTVDGHPEDELLIEHMQGHEAVSQLFEFRLRLLSYEPALQARDIVGKNAILRIETFDGRHSGGERHWNGFVSRFARTGVSRAHDDGGDLYSYECDIVPWLWSMTHNVDCRIFQNLSVPDIIETLFGEYGYSDYKLELTGSYPALDYCVQYNETTFHFISRLLERDGIQYYFRHEAGGTDTRHILVLTDNKLGNRDLDPIEVPFHHEGHASADDAIVRFSSDEQMRTGKTVMSSWDYMRKGVLQENTPTMLDLQGPAQIEHYRYGAGFDAQGHTPPGAHLARVAMEAEESSHEVFHGQSQVRGLTPGYVFDLIDHPIDAFNDRYLLLSVRHAGSNNLTTDDTPGDYENAFTARRHDQVWRPPQLAGWTRMHGPQTATVVGPAGNELFTDEHGRIKVRFHWDRKVASRDTNTEDDKASCWVRVAQAWAGNGYGTLFIPRVGMEVVVTFLEGDPDKPLVTGCVYNGLNTPPLNLPAEATRSTIKTSSSKGGAGFNELRFEDKAGEEEIFLHAQKDLQLRTGNSRTEAVGRDVNLKVGHDRMEGIENDSHLRVGSNQLEDVGANRAATVGQDDYLTVGGSQHTHATMNLAHTAGMNVDLNAGVNAALSGAVNVDVQAGVQMALEAGVTLCIKAGPSSILLSPAGVFVTGPMVMINSGGSPIPAKTAAKAEKADRPKAALDAVTSKAGKVADPVQQLQAQALRDAAKAGTPFCAECETYKLALGALGA